MRFGNRQVISPLQTVLIYLVKEGSFRCIDEETIRRAQLRVCEFLPFGDLMMVDEIPESLVGLRSSWQTIRLRTRKTDRLPTSNILRFRHVLMTIKGHPQKW